MTPRSQGSDLIKLADFRPVAADPARYLNHIGQIASKRLQDIPRAVANFSINGRPVTVPEHLPLPQSVSTGLCRACDFLFSLLLASGVVTCSAWASIVMCQTCVRLSSYSVDTSCSVPWHIKIYRSSPLLHELVFPELVKLSCLPRCAISGASSCNTHHLPWQAHECRTRPVLFSDTVTHVGVKSEIEACTCDH